MSIATLQYRLHHDLLHTLLSLKVKLTLLDDYSRTSAELSRSAFYAIDVRVSALSAHSASPHTRPTPLLRVCHACRDVAVRCARLAWSSTHNIFRGAPSALRASPLAPIAFGREAIKAAAGGDAFRRQLRWHSGRNRQKSRVVSALHVLPHGRRRLRRRRQLRWQKGLERGLLHFSALHVLPLRRWRDGRCGLRRRGSRLLTRLRLRRRLRLGLGLGLGVGLGLGLG